MNAGAPAERWQQFNALVKPYAVALGNNEISAGLPALSFIDSYQGLLAVGNSPTLYASDAIHLSADGFSYWNTWVDTIIDALMSEEGSDCAVWLSNECELYRNSTISTNSPQDGSSTNGNMTLSLSSIFRNWIWIFTVFGLIFL